MRYGTWKPYVPVAARQAGARAKMLKLQKQGVDVQPIQIQGLKIAKSFWGMGWCKHLESFSDLANRIPRGRTYVRNGSVCHLAISKGEVVAMVSGSDLYHVRVTIAPLADKRWMEVKKSCTGQVSSVLELLQGKLSSSVMAIVTDKNSGLFPAPGEMKFTCDCPDYASMCKHIAAVLYGVGARLDHQPDLLFTLRGVDHQELISADLAVADDAPKKGGRRRIAADALGDVFGIELTEDKPAPKKIAKKAGKKMAKKAAKKTVEKPAKKAAKKTALKSVRKIAKKKIPKIPKIRRAPKTILSPDPFTGEMVTTLRKKFGMTPIQFGLLAGVSTLTVQNWEAKSGGLTLRKNSQESLNYILKLTKHKAWQEMEDL